MTLDKRKESGRIVVYLFIIILMPRRSRSEELLDFEIEFYEKLLRAYPDFADVLLPLGDAYTRRGLYKQLGMKLDDTVR